MGVLIMRGDSNSRWFLLILIWSDWQLTFTVSISSGSIFPEIGKNKVHDGHNLPKFFASWNFSELFVSKKIPITLLRTTLGSKTENLDHGKNKNDCINHEINHENQSKVNESYLASPKNLWNFQKRKNFHGKIDFDESYSQTYATIRLG